MRILVLGGTVFVGRHFVEAALAEGHELTLFHRGQRGKDLFPETEHVFGDRDGELGNLGSQSWDAVVDCCGYVPRVVGQSTDFLKDKAERYLFVSTISVYASAAVPQQDEAAPVGTLADPNVEEITGETYGPLKALCERAVTEGFGERATIVRPGLIIGPYDPTNRFPYWVEKFATQDEVLVPDRPSQPMQLIDARDLGAFMLKAIGQRISGTFNAAGPESPRTLRDMVAACQTLNPASRVHWAGEAEIEEKGLQLWQDLPLILPMNGESDGMQQVDNRKAVAAGLKFRPWAESARDTWSWLQTQPPDRPRPYGAK